MTHTYAELEVSQPTYDEIAQKLREAGYDHVFMPERGRDHPTIDMHGIGLVREGTHMTETITDALLTDDMEIEIDVQLLQDRMAPKIEALAFDRDGATQRITDTKATGTWNVKREFRCRFTVRELRRLARSITTQKGREAADGGTADTHATAGTPERPGAVPGDPDTPGGVES